MKAAVAASIGRLHIVAIAGLGALTFGWLMTGVRPWAIAGVVCLDWFIVNLLNRAVDLQEDLANDIAGATVVAAHRPVVLWLGGGLLVASLVLFHRFWPEITALRLGYHALGAAYNWPILPGQRRLKTVYAAKNTASAIGFMITLFGYPLAVMNANNAPWATGFGPGQLACVAAFFFLFELSWEVVYDLRDAPGDATAGVQTFAVVHGVDRAASLADGLLAGSAVVLVAGHVWWNVPWRAAVMVVAPVVQFFLYRRWLKEGLTSRHVTTLTWLGAGLLVAYHAWIALELPWIEGAPWS